MSLIQEILQNNLIQFSTAFLIKDSCCYEQQYFCGEHKRKVKVKKKKKTIMKYECIGMEVCI